MKKFLQAIGLLFVGIAALVGMAYSQHPFNVNTAVKSVQNGVHQVQQSAPSLPAIGKNDTNKVSGSPTISAEQIDVILCTFGSPACHKGQALYDDGVKYNIDPVYALAFFQHESRFGALGEARKTMSLGNLRCINDRPCIDQDRGGYAQFNSWEDGFQHWYSLIRNVYIAQWHRETVSAILEKYAPVGDNNDPSGYAQSVEHAVALWRSGKVAV